VLSNRDNMSQIIRSSLKCAGRLLIATSLLTGGIAQAGIERDQARRIHERLTGVPPTNAVLDTMEQMIISDGNGERAALEAMKNPAFYNVTLKNYITPWTNEAQTLFAPLNDYTATVIGMIRDDLDFRGVLYDDILYTGNNVTPAYSPASNAHYVALESMDLSDPTVLVRNTQSAMNPQLPAAATAGVITTRAAAEAFFKDGTNRAMFRFTFMNHMCTDLEPLKDVSRVPDRVRQDASRSPGGDSRIFMFSCVGCHAGMDGLGGAYAKYNFNTVTGQLDYNRTDAAALADTSLNGYVAGGLSMKYLNNADNFKPGYIATDESWVNYWRNGQNKLLGWKTPPPAGVTLDERGHANGSGAKSMGAELANSQAFARCQVKKAFQAVCLHDPDQYSADRSSVDAITTDFMSNGYNMKSVFAKVADYCKTPK